MGIPQILLLLIQKCSDNKISKINHKVDLAQVVVASLAAAVPATTLLETHLHPNRTTLLGQDQQASGRHLKPLVVASRARSWEEVSNKMRNQVLVGLGQLRITKIHSERIQDRTLVEHMDNSRTPLLGSVQVDLASRTMLPQV